MEAPPIPVVLGFTAQSLASGGDRGCAPSVRAIL